jgi:hypothetical protein
MAYRQLRAPNLSTTDIPGWCLRLVLHAFGFNGGAEYARAEWDRNPHKHTDGLPGDVAVPVFFSWVGTIDGITRDWGDVAIFVPGRGVFGTPMRGGVNNRWDASVEARRIAIGGNARYLGWTESLNGVKLIEAISNNTPQQGAEEMIADANQAHQAYQLLRPNGDGSPDEINGTAGRRTWAQFANDARAEIQVRNQMYANQAAQIVSLTQQVQAVTDQAAELAKRPTQENFNALQVSIEQCNAGAVELKKQNDALEAFKKAEAIANKTPLAIWAFLKKYIPGLK